MIIQVLRLQELRIQSMPTRASEWRRDSGMAIPDMKSIGHAVCYVRKSREDEQAERRGEDTLAKQREMLTSDVLSRYAFEYDFAEEIASGDSIRDRPVFRELLHHLGSKYQAIVCKDLSRLGRGSYSDMGIVYDIIRDRRIFIITKDSIYDPHNFSDLRMIRFSLFFNREEYEMTLWRLTEGKYDGAGRGKWVAGSVPYGFVYDRHSQILKPLAEQAKIVCSIFDWYVNEKLGYQSIANRLMALSIPAPRGKSKWHSEVVRRILKNPAYHGTLAFRMTKRNKLDGKIVRRPSEEQIIVPNAFDSLIDESTWERAVARRSDSSSRSPTRLAEPASLINPVSRSSHSNELAGIITCKTCKHKLVRQSSNKIYKKKNGLVSVYKKEFLYCKDCGYAIQYRICEQQIIEMLRYLSVANMGEIANSYQALSRAANQGCAQSKVRDNTRKRESVQGDVQGNAQTKHLTESFEEQLVQRKENLERRMAKARDMLLDGVFSKTDYVNACSQYEQELSQITALLPRRPKKNVALKTDTKSTPETKEISRDFSEFHTLADIYQALKNPGLRNQLLHILIENIELEASQKCVGQTRKFNLAIWIQSEVECVLI
jgi:DNA invertase Pin-like site-specific DNA recombinase